MLIKDSQSSVPVRLNRFKHVPDRFFSHTKVASTQNPFSSLRLLNYQKVAYTHIALICIWFISDNSNEQQTTLKRLEGDFNCFFTWISLKTNRAKSRTLKYSLFVNCKLQNDANHALLSKDVLRNWEVVQPKVKPITQWCSFGNQEP